MVGGNRDIKILNKKFRKKDKTTDVLSFPFYERKQIKKLKNKKSIYLGDVILNYYKISRKNFERDFNRLWIHGFLHLLGYDHIKNKDFKKMIKIEKRIVSRI